MYYLLLIMTIIFTIPVAVFTVEILFALLPERKQDFFETELRPSITVLIPAHNEEELIEKTLESIKEQLLDNDQLLVVADNCTDGTVEIVKTFGAEVIERLDLEKRGKGYALDFGIRYLESKTPEVVIIIDADCQIKGGVLEKLAKTAISKNRPVQALYLMKYLNPSVKQRIVEFAWLIKNYVRPRGLNNLGLPCQLMGTGMAFPWDIIANTSLATGNIVEDVKMGLDMTASGYAPLFLSEACVISTFPEIEKAEDSQRKRWEHGHIGMIIDEVPKGIVKSIKGLNFKLFSLLLDLSVPPLALLMLSLVLIFSGSLIASILGNFSTIILYSGSLFVSFFIAVFLSWIVWGRGIISFFQLLIVPVYIVKKIPLYISFIFRKQKDWVRTDRD